MQLEPYQAGFRNLNPAGIGTWFRQNLMNLVSGIWHQQCQLL